MKETEITIRIYNQDRHAEEEHPVTAYADDRFPGLAIHGPWELGNDDWRVNACAERPIYRPLPTRAAATAALPIIGQATGLEPAASGSGRLRGKGKARWLRISIAAAVEQVNSDRAAAPEGRRRKRHDQGHRLGGRPGGLPLPENAPGMAKPFPRDTWRLDRAGPEATGEGCRP